VWEDAEGKKRDLRHVNSRCLNANTRITDFFVVCAANIAFFLRFVKAKTKDLVFKRKECGLLFSIFAYAFKINENH
jgi:hypothetical protein